MSSVFSFDEFELDCRASQLRYGGAPVRVDSVVLRLLESLVQDPGRLISKDELIARVWEGRVVSENALTVAMARLRRLLAEHAMPRDSILTVHGSGYRFTRVVSTRDYEPTRPGVAVPSSDRFVGRERVLLQLEGALAAARSGRGSMIALRGEAGIGKTSVADVVAQQAAAAGSVVAWGCCHELGETPPLWPFAELLRSVLRQLAGAVRTNAGIQALLPELSPLLPELVVASGSTTSDQRVAHEVLKQGAKYQVFDAVARVLTLVAESTPLVLILDDLHRADEASLDLLHFLLANVARRHTLFVATMRTSPRDMPGDSRLSLVLNHGNCIRVALEPLAQIDVERYIVAHLGAVERALRDKVYQISEGNPFCMTELVRQLQLGGRLRAASLTVPNVALELVARRLASLTDDAREVLTDAAVIGKTFGLPLLAAVTGHSASALMATLDCAYACEVVRPVAGSGTEFVFAHELLRTALYDGQSPAERRMRHLRVVHTLEQRSALAEVSCSELAHHARAGLPEGDLRKTVEYCTKAANEAERMYAFVDAIRFLKYAREALELVDDASPRLRFQLLFREAVLVRGHSSREFLPLAEHVLRLAREQDGVALAAACLLLDPFPGFPRVPVMRGALGDALSQLADDLPSLRPALLARLASSAPLAYTAEDSYRQIERALALAAHSPERGDRFTAHFGELYLYGGPQHRARAATTLAALQRLCNEDPKTGPLPLALLDLHRTLTALQSGDVQAATRALDGWALRCRELEGEMLWHLERLRALLQINLGNVAEGSEALEDLHQRAHCCESTAGTALFCVFDRSVLLGRSDPRAAHEALLRPDVYDTPNIWALKLRTLETRGAHDEARNSLELVPPEGLADLPCDREFLGTMGALARTALSLRASEYARVIYERLAPFPDCFCVNLAGLCEGSVSLLLGLLARELGDLGRAQAHLEDAVLYSERAGFMRSAAEARLERNRGMPAL